VNKQDVNELRDEIQTKLAAIRNALHLISSRSDDFMVLEYVWLAEQETREISNSVGKRLGRAKAA
jgi:hypothetical protein